MTTEEFQNKIFNKLGKEYLVLGNYINNKTPILMKHTKCGHEWQCLPMTLTRKNPTKCPNCYGTPKKTTEQFKQEVFNKYQDEYSVLGEYKSNKDKILMKHEKCGHSWEITPKDFLHGYKCPNCYGTPKKTTEQFKQEVFNKYGDEYSVLGEYIGTNTHILMKHTNCGHEWLVKPNNFLNKETRCPICKVNSKGIEKITKFLDANNIKYIKEKKFVTCKNKKVLSFDFYLPDYNLLIEFDGEFHFIKKFESQRFDEQRLCDKTKNIWCTNESISLLRIDYTNLKNIDRILKSLLIEKSSTTIDKYNLYVINEDSTYINDNDKYCK